MRRPRKRRMRKLNQESQQRQSQLRLLLMKSRKLMVEKRLQAASQSKKPWLNQRVQQRKLRRNER